MNVRGIIIDNVAQPRLQRTTSYHSAHAHTHTHHHTAPHQTTEPPHRTTKKEKKKIVWRLFLVSESTFPIRLVQRRRPAELFKPAFVGRLAVDVACSRRRAPSGRARVCVRRYLPPHG